MSTVIDLYKNLFGRKGIADGDVISLAEHGRSGGISTGQPFKFTDGVDYAIKITEVGTDLYIGFANPGTAESAAKWKAMKLDGSSGLKITWAGGSPTFNQVGTDLTALSYS
jgi:transposase